jgi:hypothetical protein
MRVEQNLAVRRDDSANSSSCHWMEPPTNTNLRLLTHHAIFLTLVKVGWGGRGR